MKDISYVGQKLRQLREKRGLTLAEVGKAIGKSPSLIGSVERIDRCPSLSSVLELAEFYEVPLSFLFEDDLDKYQKGIGEQVEKIMTQKSISTSELARKTDINYFKLADFLLGQTSLTLDQLEILANYLNIPVKHIIPQAVRYLSHIKRYLEALGLDNESTTNILNYIDSRLEN